MTNPCPTCAALEAEVAQLNVGVRVLREAVERMGVDLDGDVLIGLGSLYRPGDVLNVHDLLARRTEVTALDAALGPDARSGGRLLARLARRAPGAELRLVRIGRGRDGSEWTLERTLTHRDSEGG